MIIGIDIDEVLGDFITPFLKFHNETYGTELRYEDVFDHEFENILHLPGAEIERRLNKYFETELFKEMQPVEGAKAAVNELAKQHKLIVITARPVSLENFTRRWLDRHFDNLLKEVYFTNVFLEKGHKDRREKYEFCLDHNVEILIDDHENFSVECADHGVKVLLFSHPWNAKVGEHKNITRIYNWQEALNIINETEKEKQNENNYQYV